MSDNPSKRTSRTGAVTSAVTILRHLAAQERPMGVNAVARSTGVSQSSCFNILKTLVHEGLVDLNPNDKTYSPGSGLYGIIPRNFDPYLAFAKCEPLLRQFSEELGATAALWSLSPSEHLVLLGFTESKSTMRIHMTVGEKVRMLAGAGGRCIAAALDLSDDEIARRFAKLRWHKAPDLEVFQAEVAEVRKRGWSVDDGNVISGVTTVAVAVRDAEGRPRYVLGATFFAGQLMKSDMEDVGKRLLDVAEKTRRLLALTK